MAASTQPTTAALWSLGCLFMLKGRSDELEVIEAIVPAGYSPPLHRHDFGTESFYILEGRVRFVIGDEDTEHGPGDCAHVPRSAPHSFEVLGDEPARVLDLVAPGRLWDFFAECGTDASELRVPDRVEIPATLAEIVGRYDGRVLGPPLTRPGGA
jgi:quercetin dioxygenase-like cupin family protein